MLKTSETVQELIQRAEALAGQENGEMCPTSRLLEIAELAKGELDFHLGLGNWYSSQLVRTVGHALARYPAEVPASVLLKISGVLRSAQNIDALRFVRSRRLSPSSRASN